MLHLDDLPKGGFFSESEIRSSNLPIFQKKYSKKLSWSWNLNKLFADMGGNFKVQAQDSFFGIIFGAIGRFEKRISLSEKKAPLAIYSEVRDQFYPSHLHSTYGW